MKQSHWILISIAAGVAGVFLYKRFLKKSCRCKDKSVEKATVLPVGKGTVMGANIQQDDIAKVASHNYIGKEEKKI